ncbi:MAG TPA: hypothetical protein VKW04_02340 [Planctomycetota bacterium]|nr:hypothetical protein [Planctomycetota bacterium]
MNKKWLLGLVAAFGLGSVASYAQEDKKDPAKQDPAKQDPAKQDPAKQDPAKQDEKKPDAGPITPPFKFPASADLKTKVGLDDDQVKQVDALYAEYKGKADDAQKKIDAGEKKAKKEMASVRSDLASKLHDLCKDDDQKKKMDDALPAAKKKKDKA